MNRLTKSITGSRGSVLLWVLSVGWAVSAAAQAAVPPYREVAQELSEAFSTTAKAAMPAVVSITVEKTVTTSNMMGYGEDSQFNDPLSPFGEDFLRKFFGGQLPVPSTPRKYLERGLGSGFIISQDGYILTNNHVVGDVDKIKVGLQDGRVFTNAQVIGTDPDTEVALIKIEGNDFPVLPMGDSDTMDVGDWVIAIGNPFGLKETVTVGVISAVGRSNVHIAAYENFIQTDAAINPGNSGGPLINLNGQAIGINTAIATESGGYMGIGFAIPINMARTIAEQLKQNGRVIRGYLGVYGQNVTSDMAPLLHLSQARGIVVSQVKPGSPAANAGLQEGDVILQMNGQPVGTYDEFRNQIARMKPGDQIQLGISREGAQQQLTVTLGERPGPQQASAGHPPQPQAESQQKLGVQVTDLTQNLAQELGYQNSQGVVIARVIPGSAADEAGLQAGDLVMKVNGQPVANTDQFVQAIQAAGNQLLLLIRRGEVSQFVVVKMG